MESAESATHFQHGATPDVHRRDARRPSGRNTVVISRHQAAFVDVVGAGDPGATPRVMKDGLRILRICSVFGVRGAALRQGVAFDALGGLQNHASAITEDLDGRGHVQEIVTAYRPGAPRLEPWADRATVHRLGVPVRRMRQLWAPPAVAALARLGRVVDVVHAHQGEDIAVLALARFVAALHGLPLVVTVHCSVRHTLSGLDTRSRLVRGLGAPFERRVLPKAGAVLVLTEAMRNLVIADGLDPSRVSVVPLGIDLDRFRPSPPGVDSPPTIVYVGRLARAKGVDVLLEALAAMPRRDVILRLIGDGPERAALERQARHLGIAPRVRFVGALPAADVPCVAAPSHVLVLPSRYEELGRVNVEGMAMGLPVVATRIGGIPELVRDQVNGLLVQPEDPRELSIAIDRVLTDRVLAARLAAAGMRLARSQGIERLTDHVERTYEHVTRRLPRPTIDPVRSTRPA